MGAQGQLAKCHKNRETNVILLTFSITLPGFGLDNPSQQVAIKYLKNDVIRLTFNMFLPTQQQCYEKKQSKWMVIYPVGWLLLKVRKITLQQRPLPLARATRLKVFLFCLSEFLFRKGEDKYETQNTSQKNKIESQTLEQCSRMLQCYFADFQLDFAGWELIGHRCQIRS